MPAMVRVLGKTPEVAGGALSQALAIPAAGMPGHRGGMAGGAEHVSSTEVSICHACTLAAAAAANQPAILVANLLLDLPRAFSSGIRIFV